MFFKSQTDSLRYLANGAGSVTRTTPLGQSASNLDALLEMDLAVSSKKFVQKFPFFSYSIPIEFHFIFGGFNF